MMMMIYFLSALELQELSLETTLANDTVNHGGGFARQLLGCAGRTKYMCEHRVVLRSGLTVRII